MKRLMHRWALVKRNNPTSPTARHLSFLSKVMRGLGYVAIVSMITAILYHYINYAYGFSWSGFASFTAPDGTFYREKSLWDWLDLFVVPFTLAIVAIVFNSINIQTERFLKDDEYREQALVRCLELVSDLITKTQFANDDNGNTSESNNLIDPMVRAHILSTLRILDAKRKGRLIFFLYESHLLGFPGNDEPKITLHDSDLSYMDLAGTSLKGICLERVNLQSANLQYSDLTEAHFDNSSLTRASLLGADLTKTSFENANLLWVNLRKTIKKETDFKNAIM